MSLERLYTSIENAEDAHSSLVFVFMGNGDSNNTAERRVAECFFTRGRGRSVDTSESIPEIQSVEDEDGIEDHSLEEAVTKERLKLLNGYLEARIKFVEDQYEESPIVNKFLRSRILDLKAIYAYILSRMHSTSDYSQYIAPNIDNDPWSSEWQTRNLDLPMLDNYTKEEVYSTDKGEAKLFKRIKDRIQYDRFKILDDLINHFKSVSRFDLVEYIKVNGFRFISESSSDIMNSHKLSQEDYHVINAARVTYISRSKVDLNYALELLSLPATTYKKRSNKIKQEIVDLGEDMGKDLVNNPMKDYLIN